MPSQVVAQIWTPHIYAYSQGLLRHHQSARDTERVLHGPSVSDKLLHHTWTKLIPLRWIVLKFESTSPERGTVSGYASCVVSLG